MEAIYANDLSEPPFSFYLKRYVNQANQISAAPGGILILRGTGSAPSFCHVISILHGRKFAVVTVQGKTITIDSPSALVAIDTGTTLIGAPTPIAASIWAQVLDSTELTGDRQGLYTFLCDTNVIVHISFGATNWAISPLDMNLGILNDTMIGNANTTSQKCAGGIFDIGIGSTPSSVFVGFAQLASGLSPSTGSSDPNPVRVEIQHELSPSAIQNIAVSLIFLASVAGCFTLFL
ncbi:hypothetical protein EDB19DRAFT_1916935 [Suillus lakei]|nr:hypothetical protein EDB19DRAFT_1916935 [Suillus lakei]